MLVFSKFLVKPLMLYDKNIDHLFFSPQTSEIGRLANFLRYSTAFTYESYQMIDDVIVTSKAFSIINSKVAVLNCLRTVAVWSEVLQY